MSKREWTEYEWEDARAVVEALEVLDVNYTLERRTAQLTPRGAITSHERTEWLISADVEVGA
jgi:hypothetical protein